MGSILLANQNHGLGILLQDGTEDNLPHVITYVLVAAIILFLLYEVIVYKFFPRHYHGVKLTTKTIATIAVMAALSATVTIVISMTIPITVFPPIRIAFEGIMIKIAGMFFGPVIGIIVGMVTELLTILFVPSYVHAAYFVLAIGFGFISGLASYSRRISGGHNKWWIMAFINIFIIGYGVFMVFTTNSYTADVKFFGVNVSHDLYKYVFIAVLAATLVVIWAVILVLQYYKKNKIIAVVLPIILLAVTTEFLMTTIVSPWGDQGFLGIPKGANGYASILVLRLLESPFKVLINTIILSTVYYVLRPMVQDKKDQKKVKLIKIGQEGKKDEAIQFSNKKNRTH